MNWCFYLWWDWINQLLFEYFCSAFTLWSQSLFHRMFLLNFRFRIFSLIFFTDSFWRDLLAFMNLSLFGRFIFMNFRSGHFHIDRLCQYLKLLFFIISLCLNFGNLFSLNFLHFTIRYFDASSFLKNLSGSQFLLILFHSIY